MCLPELGTYFTTLFVHQLHVTPMQLCNPDLAVLCQSSAIIYGSTGPYAVRGSAPSYERIASCRFRQYHRGERRSCEEERGVHDRSSGRGELEFPKILPSQGKRDGSILVFLFPLEAMLNLFQMSRPVCRSAWPARLRTWD